MELPKREDHHKPSYIEITVPKKERHLAPTFFLLGFLLLIAGLAFAAGWGAYQVEGQFFGNPAEIQNIKNATDSARQKGWELYEDKEAGFSIYHPKEWKSQAHEQGQTPGVKLSFEDSSLELWVAVDQTIELNDEQKEGLSSSETSQVEVSGNKTSITTHHYEAGNYLIITIFEATEEQPQVTFWTRAVNESIKQITEEMIASFSYL